ncbi:WAT1-related protein At2g37460-like [Bidens hawaiensis]|uniref:WAT1-related protein At2g37460-like n=1 Tax=Bidens hawaiensis TaxID=980011 RepID=UPI00404A034A
MSKQAMSERISEFFQKGKPFFAVIFLQFGLAGMSVVSKVAMNEGMSSYVFVVYHHVIATVVMAPFAIVLDKKIRPKMTKSIFVKLMLLALLEPVIDQNLFFLGMKATTATFAISLSNVLPAITFVIACILRLEVVNLKSIRSQAKVVGTITTVAGAMVMTLVKGPVLELFWTKGRYSRNATNNGVDLHHSLKGAIMIIIGIFSWACFMVLQAITLKSYPAALSLTAWICFLGTIEGAIVALVMERSNFAVWAIKWDISLLATLYSGVICSGLAYYIQGIVMKDRGPVFVTAFSPLSMIIVAIMGSIILAEQTYLGRVLGAIVIVAGLYMVVWGKSKDNELSTGNQIVPEELLEKESEENGCHKVIIIESSDEKCDKQDKTVDVIVINVEPVN